jgi:hypothetical protein
VPQPPRTRTQALTMVGVSFALFCGLALFTGILEFLLGALVATIAGAFIAVRLR